MTADVKSPLEQVNDVVSQLKEMRHYAKNNVERLTAQWMLFDGELKKLHQTENIEELMTRQGELHDRLALAVLRRRPSTSPPPPARRCSCPPRPGTRAA